MIAPCKDCTERTAVCHGWCERYKEYRKECDRVQEIKTRERVTFQEFKAMRNNAFKRIKKGQL